MKNDLSMCKTELGLTVYRFVTCNVGISCAVLRTLQMPATILFCVANVFGIILVVDVVVTECVYSIY